MNHRKSFLLIACFFLASCIPAVAQESGSDRFLFTFRGGIAKGNAEYPGNHLSLGGGVHYYPFHAKAGAARRIAVGGELGRTVLYTEGFGQGERFQKRLWLMSPELRFDVINSAHLRISTHAGGVWARQTEVYQVKYNFSWADIRQLGYYCDMCLSSSRFLASAGISLALAKPVRDYNGDIRARWAFPIRYTRYSNGLKTITAGIEYSFK